MSPNVWVGMRSCSGVTGRLGHQVRALAVTFHICQGLKHLSKVTCVYTGTLVVQEEDFTV